jgi:aminomethyltransferase
MLACLKRTPLYEVHRAAGAKMMDFGGWEMPAQYSGLFDVSHMGEIEVCGSEAAKLMDYVSTNSTVRLKRGQVQYSGLLYEHGGFVS